MEAPELVAVCERSEDKGDKKTYADTPFAAAGADLWGGHCERRKWWWWSTVPEASEDRASVDSVMSMWRGDAY